MTIYSARYLYSSTQAFNLFEPKQFSMHFSSSRETIGEGKPRKTIGETIKRDLDFNSLNVDMICEIKDNA